MKALFLPWRNPIVERGRWKYNLLIALLSWSGEHTRTFTCIAGGKGCRSRIKPVYQYLWYNLSFLGGLFLWPGRERKKMDGLEFLAELAPIYRVFPSLPFTLLQHPQTHISSIKTHVTDRHILHPQTHMSSPVGKKNTNRHCVRTNQTKNTCHTQTHTAYADTTLAHNTLTKPKTQQFHFCVYSNQV